MVGWGYCLVTENVVVLKVLRDVTPMFLALISILLGCVVGNVGPRDPSACAGGGADWCPVVGVGQVSVEFEVECKWSCKLCDAEDEVCLLFTKNVEVWRTILGC